MVLIQNLFCIGYFIEGNEFIAKSADGASISNSKMTKFFVLKCLLPNCKNVKQVSPASEEEQVQ
jgi:hypothetical protein